MVGRRARFAPLLVTVFVATAYGADQEVNDAQMLYNEAETLRLTYDRESALLAIDKYAEARSLWERSGNHARAARAGQRIGATYNLLGAMQETSRYYTEALALARKSDDRLLESELQSALGMTRAILGDEESAWRAAEAQCNEAQTLALAHEGEIERAKSLNCLAEVNYARGKIAEAIGFYAEAEAIFRRSDSREDLAQTLLFLGYAHSDLSSFELADADYGEALNIWRTIADKHGTALTLIAIARMQWRQAQYQPALTQFYEARELFDQMGDVINLASSYDGIAAVYMDMGQYQNALRYWSLALPLFEEAGLKNYIPDVLSTLALAEIALGNTDQALIHLERARLLSEQSGNGNRLAYSLRLLGYAHYSLGRPQEALTYLFELLELDEATQDARLEAGALSDIGSVYVFLGEHQLAIGYLDRALQLSRKASDRQGEARDLFGIATAYAGLGDLTSARGHLETALRVAESLRAEVASQDLRASYVASVYHYYRFQVDLLMRAHRTQPQAGYAAMAFEVSERARARSLLESLAATGVDLREGVDDRLLAEEKQLSAALNEKYETQVELSNRDDQPTSQLADEIRDLEAAYKQVKARIRASSPRYASLTEPKPLTLSEAQTQLLDDDTVLLEYALGEERSYLWVVSTDAFATYTLPPRAEIDRLARQVYSLLKNPSVGQASKRQYWDAAVQLSEAVLGPAVDQIGGKRLVVVADGALQYVPFAALPTPDRQSSQSMPIIARHEIVNLPSASSMVVIRDETHDRPLSTKSVAVLADPVFALTDPRLAGNDQMARRRGQSTLGRLPHTAKEAAQITSALPGGDYLEIVGFAANRAAVTNPQLGDYRILHFATHATFNETEPGLSGLVLSQFDADGLPQDGFVRLNDIYDLRLPAELVVLSACDTALGEEIEGEGLVGIVRGFMYAGSRRVVASLWQVADAATAELMNRFYQGMLEEKLAPADALRQAQLHVMEQRRWSHPYYWAAFTLQGEWH